MPDSQLWMTVHSRLDITEPTSSAPRRPVAGISVSIVCDSSRSSLEACLRSLAAQVPAVAEVILVDRDGRARSGARPFPVRVLQAAGGPAAQRNAAALAAGGEVLAFIASDVLVEPGWAAAMAEAFRNGAAVAAGAISDSGGARCPGRRHDLSGLRDFLPSASAVNLAVRREVFDELGGFDAAVCGAEDRDFSFRAQLAGYGLTAVARAAVSAPRRTDARRRLRAARAQPALRRKYDHFVFHDALRSWREPVFGVPGETLGWLELLSGRRPVPAFEEPLSSDDELAVRPLPKGPSLVLVAARPAAAAARARLTTDVAIPPPGLLAEMLPRWDEPAPWAMRAARLAARHRWGLPVELIAKRLERERVASWGEACLALHAIFAWGRGKDQYGLVVSPASNAALMTRLPELQVLSVDSAGAASPHVRTA